MLSNDIALSKIIVLEYLSGICLSIREPSVTKLIEEQEQDQQWLTLHSNWESLNATTLHELLVKG